MTTVALTLEEAEDLAAQAFSRNGCDAVNGPAAPENTKVYFTRMH